MNNFNKLRQLCFSSDKVQCWQAGRVKKLHGVVGSTAELEKEETNKIHHGPTYKKALTDEEFARKKARYYKKLRLVGHRGEHRQACPPPCRGQFRGVATPAILCREEPVTRGFRTQKYLMGLSCFPAVGSLWHKGAYSAWKQTILMP